MEQGLIITISRELGSGGRTVGRMLAEKLDVHYSDKDLIKALRERFNLTTSALEELKGEKKNWFSRFLQLVAPVPKAEQLIEGDSKYIQEFRPDVTSDEVYKAESEILQAIADEGPCVIAGRSAFFVLKNHPNKVDIFITASRDYRIARVTKKQNLTPEQAASVIDSVDKARENYISHYTGLNRYDARNYNLCICMDKITEEEAVEIILAYLRKR